MVSRSIVNLKRDKYTEKTTYLEAHCSKMARNRRQREKKMLKAAKEGKAGILLGR